MRDRVRLALRLVRHAWRRVFWPFMFACGFVPRGLYQATFEALQEREARLRAMDADRRALDVWQSVAEVRKAVLVKHKLYSAPLAALEGRLGLISPETAAQRQ